MTRRQIYFCNTDNGTCYVSEEYNGDKSEMERLSKLFGNGDTCEKNWSEIMDELNEVHSLSDFLQAISRITGYYHSSVTDSLPGTRFRVCHSESELPEKDETYVIYSDKSGVYLDLERSTSVKGKVFP